MINWLQNKLKKITDSRPPDFIIGKPEDPYLLRWFLFKKRFNDKSWLKNIYRMFPKVYLHKFLKSDWDRALHDHPSSSISFVFEGEYLDHIPGGVRHFKSPALIYRNATTPHRVELIDNKPAYTLFIFLPKFKHRVWGFHCKNRWVPWQEFVDENDFGNVGRGCGESD
jgi:hypothetical protein